MISQRKYFARRKGNSLPVVRGNAKWCGALLGLNLAGDNWEVGGGGRDVAGVSTLGSEARSYGICKTFPLFCCHACKKWQYRGLSRDLRESRVEVVEGGLPHISARGYIIISKVKI